MQKRLFKPVRCNRSGRGSVIDADGLRIYTRSHRRVDGCGWFQSYWRIVMPLAAPGLVTMVILEFVWFWNEYLVALTMIQKEAVRTVMLGVMVMANTYQLDFSLLTAGIVIAVVPPILIYIFFQKYLIRGLTAGAIK